MGEWRDISTAPKDGSVFLAMCDGTDWPEAVKWFSYEPDSGEELQDGFWGYADDILNDVSGGADPEFWMPLPAPPKQD